MIDIARRDELERCCREALSTISRMLKHDGGGAPIPSTTEGHKMITAFASVADPSLRRVLLELCEAAASTSGFVKLAS